LLLAGWPELADIHVQVNSITMSIILCSFARSFSFVGNIGCLIIIYVQHLLDPSINLGCSWAYFISLSHHHGMESWWWWSQVISKAGRFVVPYKNDDDEDDIYIIRPLALPLCCFFFLLPCFLASSLLASLFIYFVAFSLIHSISGRR